MEALADIRGVSPSVQLDCEPWGSMDHSDGHCSCRCSDRTAAYVHDLAFIQRESVMSSSVGGCDSSFHYDYDYERSCIGPCLGVGRPGSVPFVSDRPGA